MKPVAPVVLNCSCSSEDAEGIVDLKGIPYAQLKNALRYRTEYVQDCTCRGNPWDPEAIARHRGYAEAAKSVQEKSGEDKRQAAPTKTNHNPIGGPARKRVTDIGLAEKMCDPSRH